MLLTVDAETKTLIIKENVNVRYGYSEDREKHDGGV